MMVISANAIAEKPQQTILLQADNFEHIQFKRIQPNQYVYANQQLKIIVNDSASFLMKPFDSIKKIGQVSFEWRSEGAPKVKDAHHEEQKSGDDAVFKLGLLLESDDSSLMPFLPSWMKRVESLLTFPSENMINLVVAARHSPNTKWINPYNKRVTMISMASVKGENGWQQSSYQFEKPVNVVALWLMSDGDNTGSRFTVHVKNIKMELN
ncbi:MAG: DUF3047 domain-containing protein [Gammaproteobacteria bacterium]|nr:DUF3047 domain-containing protein [Gammaproteobacteria bacterium]